jgi:hypothetical protein
VTTISSPRRGILALLAAVAMLVLLTGCSSGDDDETSTADAPAGDDGGSSTDPTDGDTAGGGAAPSSGEGTLVVDLEPTEGVFVEGFDVTLQVYDADDEVIAEREWSEIAAGAASDDPQGYYTYVHEEPVPAGPVRLVSFMRISPGGAIPPPQGPGCETTVDVADGDTARVTLLFQGDPNAADGCAAVAAATAEADEQLAMPRGLPAPGFVGLTVAEAEALATERGWTVRVVAEDGERFIVTEDYNTERVNLVVEAGTVTAAARS